MTLEIHFNDGTHSVIVSKTVDAVENFIQGLSPEKTQSIISYAFNE